MTKITIEETKKVAKLTRIKLDEKELEFYSSELGKIISWVGKLNEVDTSNIEPLFAINDKLSMFNDKIKYGDMREDVLANSPERNYDFYTVPKMIEE